MRITKTLHQVSFIVNDINFLANDGIDTVLPEITAETLSGYAAQITENDDV